MTTKVNPFMQRGKVRMPGSTPAAAPAPGENPRITIEVDMVRGGSNLTTFGPLSLLNVFDILLGQVISLWKQLGTELVKSSALVDPKTGLPLAASPSTPTPVTESNSEPGGSPEMKPEGETVQ